jgi:hypothetical protein
VAANDITPAGVVAAANRILACTLDDLARVFGVAPTTHTLRTTVSDLLASGYLRQIGEVYAPGRPYDADQADAVPATRRPNGVSPGQTGPPDRNPRPPTEFGGPTPDELSVIGDTDSGGGEYLGSALIAGKRGVAGLAVLRYSAGEPAGVVLGTRKGAKWTPIDTRDTDPIPHVDPWLSPAEARQVADAIDEVVAMGDAGATPYRPTGVQRTAEKIADLLDDAGLSIVGGNGEAELSAAEVRRLLALVPTPEATTSRRVRGRWSGTEMGGDDGAVHVHLATDRGDGRYVDLCAVEGTNAPADRDVTARMTLDGAAEFAGRLRQFARAAEAAARQTGTRS